MGKSIIKIELPRQMELTEALVTRELLHAALDSYIAAHHKSSEEGRWLWRLAELIKSGFYDHELVP